jgi:hypothetical protein
VPWKTSRGKAEKKKKKKRLRQRVFPPFYPEISRAFEMSRVPWAIQRMREKVRKTNQLS